MSSANDMAKYLQFHVKGGKNQKGQQVVEVRKVLLNNEKYPAFRNDKCV
jgi:hypothetical protein